MVEDMKALIAFIFNNAGFAFLGMVTLIQISPIKIDPWSWLFNKVKTFLVGDLVARIDTLERTAEEDRVKAQRWNILDFINSCRQGRKHSKEEWTHCIDELLDYESYCEAHNIQNGAIVEDGKLLRRLYQEHLESNDFLE